MFGLVAGWPLMPGLEMTVNPPDCSSMSPASLSSSQRVVATAPFLRSFEVSERSLMSVPVSEPLRTSLPVILTAA